MIVVRDAVQAIAFYTEVFGATEALRLMHFHRVGHCVMYLGSSEFVLLDEFPEANLLSPLTAPPSGGGPGLMLEVMDVDVVVAKALARGATVNHPPEDQWWGVRSCALVDPFGHRWTIVSKIEDVSPAEMQRRADEMGLYPPPDQEEKRAARGEEVP